ncbi:pyridoxal phosphate-dependent transferase [Zychaea mexicana]|uniref:pyridoxal phosphate-dependent transferase n=1 Tax=Zychaea mexicana TaxID=64656 RepID=UPI0022FDE6A1|nr:pyridoxal phosphate-dependent transferase [Zychaea mexicana]KAI9496015.1 pyridoxal phosphate-dependent transferase [Zychaea mexicana]
MLQKHISSESKIRNEVLNPSASGRDDQHLHSLAYSSRYATADIPKFELPEGSCEPVVAYQLVHDELELDGRPTMNCASFVHTWMEPEADKLIMENISKNLSDQDEYPATMRVQGRCISIIGNLWNAKEAIGTATVGSSEAVMLGGLAMKKMWQGKRREQGKDTYHPNIVFGNNAQVALEKFARYWDVEARIIPVSEESHHVLDVNKAVEACDENTIGMFVILGSTYTGHFEDVKHLAKLLDDLEEKKGYNIPIHVDAASGGFVAPFAFPKLEWDFRLPRVVSINTSGHKFGLSYAGIGWILWRSEQYLPKELIFELHYLGGTEYTYNLNFSRPACFMISQYYNFIRLGMEGYTRIVVNDLTNARLLSEALEKSTYFDMVSDMHRADGVFGWRSHTTKQNAKEKAKKTGKINYNPSLPVVSFKLTDEFKNKYPHVKQAAISTLLRSRGWIIPNYALPPAEDTIEILRVVVRESLSRDMIDRMIDDIISCTNELKSIENEVDDSVYGLLEQLGSAPKLNKRESEKEKENKRKIKKPRTYAATC